MKHATLCIVLVMLIRVASADPLSGKWALNVSKTHYGGGAEPRKQEVFACELQKERLRCTITSDRLDGKHIVGTFAAAYDGKPYATTGIPDVDSVSLRRVDDHLADATFYSKGKPIFGYRAIKSDDGRSLIIVAVDPIARTILNSVVVYDRQ
jgi:hypothetical protein